MIEFHEVANILPMMAEEEFTALVADIKANGQIEPVWMYQDKIIDGRNRYKACLELGIEPQFRKWNGDEANLLSFVLSLNLQRRHLSSSQKAILAVEVEKYLAVEAERRMLAGKKADPVQKVAQGYAQGKAAEQAARIVGTNRQYVLDAKRVMEQAPEVGAAVRSGLISIPDATVIARMPGEQRLAVLEKVPTVHSIYPNKVKRAIEVVQKAAEEEAWQRRYAENEAELQAQIARRATPEYKKEQEEQERENERIRKQNEERQRAWTERVDAWAAEIQAAFRDPSSEQERTLLYEAARETNMHMKQAGQAYMLFLRRFNELAGWVDRDERMQHPPEDWYRNIRGYSAHIGNMGPDLGNENIVPLRLNFRVEGGVGSSSISPIDIEALQRWIEDPTAEE